MTITLQEGLNELNISLTPIAVPRPDFYMPPVLDFWIDHVTIVGYYYHRITYATVITNKGSAPGTHSINWEVSWNGNVFSSGSRTITLNPGESYEHRQGVDIDFTRSHSATFKVYGNWQDNNYSEGYLVEGDVVIGNLIEEKFSEWRH